MSNNLSKFIVLNQSTFDILNKKYSDSDFLQRKLLPIYATHSLKDINKWNEIKQELSKYLIGKQKMNEKMNPIESVDFSKWKNLRDNETQTKKVYKKHINTQTMENKLIDVGTQANFNFPEEVFSNIEDENSSIDMDTTIHKSNHSSATSTAKRLKHFANKGLPKIIKLAKDDNKSSLKQTTLPYQYSPRLTRNQRKYQDFEINNVKWSNI